MINRTLNDMAEELFVEIVKAELQRDPRNLQGDRRGFTEGEVIGYAHAARRIAGIYFKEMYGADE